MHVCPGLRFRDIVCLLDGSGPDPWTLWVEFYAWRATTVQYLVVCSAKTPCCPRDRHGWMHRGRCGITRGSGIGDAGYMSIGGT